MIHVFTYGTLMFPEVWQAVAGRQFSSVGGQVVGCAVYRVRDAVYPGMRAAADDEIVRGVVYLDVDGEVFTRLDQFEGDTYERRVFRVVCDDGQDREAHAYVVSSHELGVLSEEHWSADEFVARGDLARFIARYAGFRRIAADGG